MKSTLMASLVIGLGLGVWTAQAGDVDGRKGLTAEQQQQRYALVEKYDANGDGVLDKAESKQLSKSDKKALAKLGGVGTTKKSAAIEKAEKAEKVEKAAKAEKEQKEQKVKEAKDEVKANKEKAEKVGRERPDFGSDAVRGSKSKGKK